jgi:hypothetical protein
VFRDEGVYCFLRTDVVPDRAKGDPVVLGAILDFADLRRAAAICAPINRQSPLEAA